MSALARLHVYGGVVDAPVFGTYALEPDGAGAPIQASRVIYDFVHLWAVTASCPAHRARALRFMGDPRMVERAYGVEARRTLAVEAWGKARLRTLLDFAGPAAGAIRAHAGMVLATAMRTYGDGSLGGLRAAWMAPPIDAPVIPDVAMAIHGARGLTKQLAELQTSYDALVRTSLEDAEKTMTRMLEEG